MAINRIRIGRGGLRYAVGFISLMCVVAAWFSLSQHIERPKHRDLHNGLALRVSEEGSDRDIPPTDRQRRPPQGVPALNPHPYSFVLNNPDKCKKSEDVFLLVMVSTKHLNHRLRYEIRQTWGKETNVPGATIKVLFAVGLTADTVAQKALEHENRIYKDIIQEDFMDSDRNRTVKTIMSLKWSFQFCPQARYVMKAYDDTFVNVFSLVKYLREFQANNAMKLITGRVLNRTKPVRDLRFIDKWYVSQEDYERDVFPKYPRGFAYVMSNDTTKLLYRASLTTKYLFLEDVYIGICLEKLGIVPVHHDGFCSWYVDVDSCNADWLLASQWFKEPEAMMNSWETLTSSC